MWCNQIAASRPPWKVPATPSMQRSSYCDPQVGLCAALRARKSLSSRRKIKVVLSLCSARLETVPAYAGSPYLGRAQKSAYSALALPSKILCKLSGVSALKKGSKRFFKARVSYGRHAACIAHALHVAFFTGRSQGPGRSAGSKKV